MPKHLTPIVAFVAMVAGVMPSPAGPAEKPVDKSQYHLFNPTPREHMRELATDRPDQTENAISVDAGHFQLEMDLVKLTYDRRSPDGTTTREWNVAPINLKIGLLDNVDLQIVLDNYVDVRERDAAGVTRRFSGFGDIALRLKVNLWGNNGGPTALAIMPYVKLPLNASVLRNGETEGGIIVPFVVDFGGGWGMGLMTQVDFVSNGGGGYDTEWANFLTVGRDLTDRLAAYLEFVGRVGTARGFPWQGQVDCGVTYAVNRDVQLDMGCNFGVSKGAPDYQPFIGLTIRY